MRRRALRKHFSNLGSRRSPSESSPEASVLGSFVILANSSGRAGTREAEAGQVSAPPCPPHRPPCHPYLESVQNRKLSLRQEKALIKPPMFSGRRRLPSSNAEQTALTSLLSLKFYSKSKCCTLIRFPVGGWGLCALAPESIIVK